MEVNEPTTFESSIIRARPDSRRANSLFLYYLFNSPQGRYLLGTILRQVAVSGITGTDLVKLKVPTPPLKDQRAIACILGALDDKIELNRRMNRTLEATARAIFKSWFVDFDPVRAKAAAHQPPGLKPDHAALFPDAFEDSELGPIPRGWRVGMLGDVTSLLSGYAFKSRDWIEQGTPVVKIGSVKPGIVDLAQVSYVPNEVATAASRFRLNVGDLLIGMTGYVGEVGLVPPTKNPPLLNQRVGKFALEQSGSRRLGFIYCLTRRSEFRAAVERKSHGTAQANVSAQGILSVEIVIPPKSLRDCFDDLCHPLLEQILVNHSVSRTIAALRDALLPKLVSGELRVPDAERIVGRAV
jgi:type I restriction enzyme S subunit